MTNYVKNDVVTALEGKIEETRKKQEMQANLAVEYMQQSIAGTYSTYSTSLMPVYIADDPLIRYCFVVDPKGKVLFHSDANERARLKGNIKYDEISYKEELILKALSDKEIALLKLDYYLPEMEQIAFSGKEMVLFGKFIPDNRINSTLYSKRIKLKKGYGTANVITTNTALLEPIKEQYRIYNSRKTTIMLFVLPGGLLLFTLLFACFQLLGLKQTRALPMESLQPEITSMPVEGPLPFSPKPTVINTPEIHVIEADISSPRAQKVIQDAIPIKKRSTR